MTPVPSLGVVLVAISLAVCNGSRNVADSAVTPSPTANAASASALSEATRGKPNAGDTIITGKVKSAIAANSGMKESDVSVSTDR